MDRERVRRALIMEKFLKTPEHKRFLKECLSDYYVDQIAKKYLEKVREERVLELQAEIERLEGMRNE